LADYKRVVGRNISDKLAVIDFQWLKNNIIV